MIKIGNDKREKIRTLKTGSGNYRYYSLEASATAFGLGDVQRLPYCLKVLLENMIRFEDGKTVTVDDIKNIADWLLTGTSNKEIAFRPARVLMQDFTGVPAVADLAAMRDAMVGMGGDPAKINPLSAVDLVIDHSVMVDAYGSPEAARINTEMEFDRNRERYEFLRWGQKAFDNFRVVPPGTGICHQVNIEYLARVVWTSKEDNMVYPDTLFGTDSHTTMVNALAVLGWGVGGIEAEAVMLGQPISMRIPEVIGFKLSGALPEGATATDLVLNIVKLLRDYGVVGKFVEFFGPGLDNLSLPERATIANMAPEYGATCGFFPIDHETLRYLAFTGREPEHVALVEAYAKAQGMWRDSETNEPQFTDTLELDMASVKPSISGPKRPQDKIELSLAKTSFMKTLGEMASVNEPRKADVKNTDYELRDGDVLIAAITSCTNTSNPSVLIGAGLLARNAADKGLRSKPWVKTSLAPGSQVVAEYLETSGLQEHLDLLGFNVVGFGCTTCIGNSGPLDENIIAALEKGDLIGTAVLSGNRNFEGRISPHVKANYLASPPLVVAYAIAGSMARDILKDPLGKDSDGNPVYLKDIWPSDREILDVVETVLKPEMYKTSYADVFKGDSAWQAIKAEGSTTYAWDKKSTYVRQPPFFETGDEGGAGVAISDISGARALAILGDSVTTDHISPAGAIKIDSPAGDYLKKNKVKPGDFNSYGSRRGNHEVMMRGTFANIRIRNEMAPGTEGGITRHIPDNEEMPIFDAAMKYADEGTPLIVIAGTEYGTGSSRDWAAKGTRLLGVKAVIVESFERIHRSNLLGMGVLPLEFTGSDNRKSLELDGTESFDIEGLKDGVKPAMNVTLRINRADGRSEKVSLLCRIDTADEAEYLGSGGILSYVLENMNREDLK